MADAGRIVIIPKGEYKSNITYERLDAVEYNNNGYIALKTVTGITPTNDGTNWALYVKGGAEVDSELSDTSTNAVQNKIVTAEISALKKENTNQSTEMLDIKMLGWSVPRECPIQNEVNGNQFVQKVGRVDLGEMNWTYYSESGHEGLRGEKPENSKPVSNNNYIGSIYTSVYETSSADDVYHHKKDKIISINISGHISVYDSSYTDASTFKQAMQGRYLYYELATPITKTIDGNEGETVSDVRKETTVNLLNSTLQTTEQEGITCTNNSDGTYTLKGTAINKTFFAVGKIYEIKGKKYKLTGCPLNGSYSNTYALYFDDISTGSKHIDEGYGRIFTAESTGERQIYIVVREKMIINNLTFKPMLTTNLNATLDDFVPYTGDAGSLNGDVASLLKRIQALESQFASETSELCSDAIDDLASVVSTQDEAIDELATIVTESEEK